MPISASASFKNARGLTQAQIDAVGAWIDGGMPEGEGSPPLPPKFPPNGWQVPLSRPPDTVLDLPFGEFELPAQGEVPTFTVWIKLPFRDDRFIQAIEMRPSVRNAVHPSRGGHILGVVVLSVEHHPPHGSRPSFRSPARMRSDESTSEPLLDLPSRISAGQMSPIFFPMVSND